MARPRKENTMSKRICFRIDNEIANKLDIISKFNNISDFLREMLEKYLNNKEDTLREIGE